MCIDAFAPWVDKQSYSITPIMFQVLNLPENLRHKPNYMVLAGIIPGPKKAKSIQPYLAIIVDELLQLYRHGIEYTHPHTKEKKISRVKLLFTCADYPGHSDINCQQCQGAKWGCMKCEIQVKTTNIVYTLCYARVTHMSHPMSHLCYTTSQPMSTLCYTMSQPMLLLRYTYVTFINTQVLHCYIVNVYVLCL
jgi:hypothetical protein